MKYCTLSICVFTLVCCSKEETTDAHTTVVEYTTVQEKSSNTAVNQSAPTTNPFRNVLRNIRVNRTQYSRMRDFEYERTTVRTSTVPPATEYDYWWFFTTPKRPISYRDFPGKPGVATWKEISPAVVRESKSKKTDPTAAGVSSIATRWRVSLSIAWLVFLAALWNT